MLFLQYEDDAYTTLAANLGSGDGAATVVDGSVLPAAGGTSDYFYATLRRAADGAKETVKCSGVVGNAVTISARAQGTGEVALDFITGDSFIVRTGRDLLDDFRAEEVYHDQLSIAGLRTKTGVAGQAIYVSYHTTAGDQGQGWFRWDATSASADDDGAIILPTGHVGAGRWIRDFDGPASLAYYGKWPSGATACSAAYSSAAALGRGVYFPGTADPTTDFYTCTASLASVMANQEIFGDGTSSRVVQLTANASVISVTHDACSVHDLQITAVGSKSSYVDGCGVIFNGVTGGDAYNLLVNNHRGGGVLLLDCSKVRVHHNRFESSSIVQATDDHTEVSADVAVYDNSSYNTVDTNICVSGQGVGVTVQTTGVADVANHNIITNNIIEGCGQYGVNVYRVGSHTTGELVHNIVADNTIRNITGVVEHATDGLVYGTGIYIQGAEYSVVDGNSIYHPHSGAVTHKEQLAPGAIGVANVTNVTISDNTCDTCDMWGVYVNDANALGSGIGGTNIQGNIITNVVKSGIKIARAGNITIDGNTIDTVGIHGINVLNTVGDVRGDIRISDNDIMNPTQAGIVVDYSTMPIITGNRLNDMGTHGIYITNSTDPTITANVVNDFTVFGVIINTNCTRGHVDGNQVRGDGSSTAGIYLGQRCTGNPHSNGVANCAASWDGDYSWFQTTTPAAGIWEQGDIIYQPNASASGFIGWVITTGGDLDPGVATGVVKTWGAITA